MRPRHPAAGLHIDLLPAIQRPSYLSCAARNVLVMDDYYDNYDEYGQYENDLEEWETNQVYQDMWLEAEEENEATEETDYEGIEF